ncbi:MAG: hypothetical protein ACXW3D_00310 [Caulobacteraceae bacterium]
MAQLALAACALLGLVMGFKNARPTAQFAPERPAAYATNALATGQPVDAKAIDPSAQLADEASDEEAAAASDAAADAAAAVKAKPKPKPKPAASEDDAAAPTPAQPAPPTAQTPAAPPEPEPETPPF